MAQVKRKQCETAQGGDHIGPGGEVLLQSRLSTSLSTLHRSKNPQGQPEEQKEQWRADLRSSITS